MKTECSVTIPTATFLEALNNAVIFGMENQGKMDSAEAYVNDVVAHHLKRGGLQLLESLLWEHITRWRGRWREEPGYRQMFSRLNADMIEDLVNILKRVL